MLRASSVFTLALLFTAGTFGSSVVQKSSAVQKVIELLDELKGKVQSDLEREGQAFSDYAVFCDDSASDKHHAITNHKRELSELGAAIEDGEASIASYNSQIEDLGNKVSDMNSQLYQATQARDAQHTDFLKEEAEMIQSIDELEKGVAVLKQGQSFLQGKADVAAHWTMVARTLSSIVDAVRLDLHDSSKLQSFLQATKKKAEVANDDDDLDLPSAESLVQEGQAPNPKVAAFESQGGAILETMTNLVQKGEKTLADTRKEELQARNSYEMTKAGLEQEIEHSNDKVSKAQANKAATEQQTEDARSKKLQAQNTKAADESYAATLKTECQTKAREWEERSRSGAGEVGAIEKAIAILTQGVVAFAQVSAVTRTRGSNAIRERITGFLQDLSHQYSSFALAQLATAAASDPFVKIRGLVENMISKLQKEANEDATHEAFCEEELSKSKEQQETKTAAHDKHKARMDSQATEIASLTQAIATLQSQIADIDKNQAAATEMRSKENAEFTQASSDFRQSATAVARATQTLKSYYEGSFIQVRSRTQRSNTDQPEFGAARSDSGGTIISVLEMAEQDFTSLLAESESTEADAKRAYDKLTQENQLARATKTVDMKSKKATVNSVKVALEHSTEDYDSVSKEVEAVNSYLAKLQPECASKGMSYAERKAARTAELQGLQEALTILEGDF